MAQSVLAGKVMDAQTGEPLVGASVLIHELDRGTITDLEGKFVFENVRQAPYHLHVRYLGYQSESMVVNPNGEKIEIALDPTSLELNEIVVESNHYKTGPKEHTLSMKVIDEEYLKKNRKNSLVNSLEDLPGISSINTGVGISKPVIRGLSFNRVIVNDQGVKQEGQQWGTDHGLEIDMFAPGRVEIVKGANSLMYGSDGLGGVLNIMPPPLPKEEGITGEFEALYKTNNNAIATSSMVQGKASDFVYRLRISTNDFGDYRVPDDEFTYNSFNLPLYNEQLKNTAGKERNVTAMAGIKKNWGYSTLTVSNFHQEAGFFVGAIGIPRSYQLTPDGDARDIDLPRQIINHFKVISNSNILVGKNWLELDIGYQNNYRREESEPHAHGKGPRPEGQLAHGLRLQTATINARYFLSKTKNYKQIIGFQGQYQKNQREGFEFLLPAFSSFSAGAFMYNEYSWKEKFTFTAGARLDFANRDIQNFEEPIYADETTISRYYERNPDIRNEFTNLSGALGLSYYPNRQINIKVNLGSSFKVPTPAELAMNGVHHGTFRHERGDSTLSSERGYQADLSLSYQLPNFSFVLSPYFSYFQGFIYLAPTAMFSSGLDPQAFPEGGQVFQYRQHDAIYTGGELSIEYHPVHQLHIKNAVEYVYNYNLNTRLPLPFTPPPSIFTEVNYALPFNATWVENIRIGANHKRVFDQNRVDRNEFTTPGYHLVGLNLGCTFYIKEFQADLLISVQNLADTRYFNHMSRYRLLNLPEQGRNIVFSINIPFAIQ